MRVGLLKEFNQPRRGLMIQFLLQIYNIQIGRLEMAAVSAAYEASYGAVYPSSRKLAESKHADVQESARCRYAVNLGRLSRPLRQ
jgi:hypothetical protein